MHARSLLFVVPVCQLTLPSFRVNSKYILHWHTFLNFAPMQFLKRIMLIPRSSSMYEHRLAPLRDQKIKMLEIGLGCDMGYGPGASYYTWLEYFPHVDLYYIEYDAECAHKWANKTDKATIFTGDQADTEFLTEFMLTVGGNFDVIIDDGGHTMNQQRASLKTLWPAIKPGGIYFIEDLATSYIAKYGGGAIGSDTMMNDLKIMLDDINRAPEVPITFPKVSNQVVSFEFTQEVVALTKFS
jgi:hypothetical protein